MFKSGEWHVGAWLPLGLAICFQVSSSVYFGAPIESFTVILSIISVTCCLVIAARHVRAGHPAVIGCRDGEEL